jgi:hypothetical protein
MAPLATEAKVATVVMVSGTSVDQLDSVAWCLTITALYLALLAMTLF